MAKRTADLPIHFRTGLRAVGIVAGRPVWPILGGEDSTDAAAQAAARAAADAAAAKGNQNDADSFPPNTPVAEMTIAQQAAYWKDKSRKHEGRVTALGNLTPERLAELTAAEARVKTLELDLGSETDRAVATAKETAKAEARAELIPELVHARFEAAAGDRLTGDQITAILAPLDTKYFLDANGKVDTAKVTAYVEGIAPAKGAEQQRRGPSAGGTGRVGTTAPSGGSVAAGREMFENRRGNKRTA